LDAELERIGAEGSVDARGVTISTELLRRLLAAAPREDNRPVFKSAQFEQATLPGISFSGVIFQGEAQFGRATFQGEAWFDGATFHGLAGFGKAVFHSLAGFGDARFQREAWFGEAVFHGTAGFGRAVFHSLAGFGDARFQREAWFGEAVFHGTAGFGRATFHDAAMFNGSTFHREAGFAKATFHREAWFTKATFEHAERVGPLLARELVLDGAVFVARVQLDVAAAAVCARRTQFPAGALLRLRYASVVLDDANLAAPAILAAVSSPFPAIADQERQVARYWQRLPPGPRQQRWRPRVLSLRRADVAGLRLANVDLRACRFAAAHNLDRLRIEGAPLFARTTGWWRARRKTLAEEQHWRLTRPGRWRPAGWYPPACQPPVSVQADTPRELEPGRLAALYRDLRKGREDAKDEPGAADFYYGECEMRRHDPSTPRAERLVLWLYWLLSGYGLRAWRALTALVLAVVLAGIVLAFWGFPSGSPSFRPVTVNHSGALVYEQQPADQTRRLGWDGYRTQSVSAPGQRPHCCVVRTER
jgi:uncharacterized protein YjbI with pentapeptide repeats